MKCAICDSSDWHSLPKEVNFQKRNLQVCKQCGNLAFHIEPEEEKELKRFYKKDYRESPTVINLITTTHKLNYIKLFLRDWIKDKKNMVVGDVGCATGYLLNWFRMNGHKATGSEYGINFRRFSEHFYGIPITEELETKYKYDLIVMYHTLEHFVEPDKKLEHYISLLKDDGYLLISCPKWLDVMEEHGGSEWKSFEHYFHLNHINIFTTNSLKNLFKKFNLKIIKSDYIQYGQTYLLQKASERQEYPDLNENYLDVEQKVLKIKQASDCFAKKDFKGAIGVWERFPDAISNIIFGTYMKEPESQQDLFRESFENVNLKENTKMRLSYAVWLFQHQKYEEAFKEFEWLINVKPNEDVFMYAGWCLSNLKRFDEAKQYYYQAQNMNPQKWMEAMNWICQSACALPTWDEKAETEIKEQLFDKAKPDIKLNDPNMNEDIKENDKKNT